MKTKCFILILLSCLFFTLYSCGKTEDSGENISSGETIDDTITYELGEYDVQNTVKNNGKKDIYYLNVNIPITNTSSSMAIIPIFLITYTIQGDSFSKIAKVHPYFLAPNETGNITLETNSDRDEIVFNSVEEKNVDKAIILDIVDKNVITKYHTGQNQSDCYDYDVLKMTVNPNNYLKYFLMKNPSAKKWSASLEMMCWCITQKQEDYFNEYQYYNDYYLFPNFELKTVRYNSDKIIENVTIEFKGTRYVSLNNVLSLYVYVICN